MLLRRTWPEKSCSHCNLHETHSLSSESPISLLRLLISLLRLLLSDPGQERNQLNCGGRIILSQRFLSNAAVGFHALSTDFWGAGGGFGTLQGGCVAANYFDLESQSANEIATKSPVKLLKYRQIAAEIAVIRITDFKLPGGAGFEIASTLGVSDSLTAQTPWLRGWWFPLDWGVGLTRCYKQVVSGRVSFFK